MLSNRLSVLVYALGAICIAIAGGLVLKVCRPDPNKLYSIAEMTNIDGCRFVVAQTHVDWVEGWDATFWFVDHSNRYFSFGLEMETGQWRAAKLTLTNGEIAVWGDRYVSGPQRLDLIGTFNPETRIFHNTLNNYDATNNDGSIYSTNPFIPRGGAIKSESLKFIENGQSAGSSPRKVRSPAIP